MSRRSTLVCGALLWSGAAVAASGIAGQVRDVDGTARNLFRPDGKAAVLIFVASDCPVSNGYAPEIQRICHGYAAKGVGCTLVYEDVTIDAAAVRAHRAEYRYHDVPAVIDAARAIARRARATITPEAVVVDGAGAIRYRGRIDNFYAALGKPRQVVTMHDLVDALDAVVSGGRVAHPETQALGCFIVQRTPS